LDHINLGDAQANLVFPHFVEWRKSAVEDDGRHPLFQLTVRVQSELLSSAKTAGTENLSPD